MGDAVKNGEKSKDNEKCDIDNDDLAEKVNTFLGKPEPESRSKLLRKKIRTAEIFVVLIMSGATTFLYTVLTLIRAYYCFGNASLMHDSGFYYMIIVAGLMWVNTTACLAIGFILRRKNDGGRLTFGTPMKCFIFWKIVMICLLFAVLLLALCDSSLDSNLSLKPLQFGLPLILHILTYLIFMCSQCIVGCKGILKE